MQEDLTSSLQEHLTILERALCTLQNLSLLADKDESLRLEATCQRMMSHIRVLRSALQE